METERRRESLRAPRALRAAPALSLERRSDARLWAVRDGAAEAVQVQRCFPWSDPGRWFSLRNEDGDEVALVRDPAELDVGSRSALESALIEAGFVLEVERILEVEEEIEIRSWKVETKQGERWFQTPRDEWPRDAPGGGLLVRDVSGDLFYIREPEKLDAESARLLWAFVD